jgi:DNA polymerase (family 10)
MQDRFYIAASLREIGRLLALKGENPFKAQAYERGARAFDNLEDEMDAVNKTRRLTKARGRGRAQAWVKVEVDATGLSVGRWGSCETQLPQELSNLALFRVSI